MTAPRILFANASLDDLGRAFTALASAGYRGGTAGQRLSLCYKLTAIKKTTLPPPCDTKSPAPR